jgi:molecular chaperone GrpE
LARKKKQHVDAQPDPPEPTPDAPELDQESENTGADHVEDEKIKEDTPVESGGEEASTLEDEFEADPRRPTDKEVLNRLLEKNEIILTLNRDNAEKDKQLKELSDKWLRSVAEFENYRKRTRKEWELLKQQSKAEVILEILTVVDDFERAFSVAEDASHDEVVDGIKLIYNNLSSVLEKFGVSEIDAHKRSFDPNFHMAVGQIETGDVPSGHIAEVVQKGYRLDDTVIRPARVIVAK